MHTAQYCLLTQNMRTTARRYEYTEIVKLPHQSSGYLSFPCTKNRFVTVHYYCVAANTLKPGWILSHWSTSQIQRHSSLKNYIPQVFAMFMFFVQNTEPVMFVVVHSVVHKYIKTRMVLSHLNIGHSLSKLEYPRRCTVLVLPMVLFSVKCASSNSACVPMFTLLVLSSIK
jgi:hypothetical protein